MKTLLVSDLHSNRGALAAVMRKVRRKGIGRIICLGDFVGYGAQPNPVVDVMRMFRAEKLYIRGNHDRVASGIDDGSTFNHVARAAALWTRNHLSVPNLRFLEALPQGPIMAENGIMLCHGSPFDEDAYVFGEAHAASIFEAFDARVVLFGHTHLPVLVEDLGQGVVWMRYVRAGGVFKLEPNRRYLINPGSVGQPRDRNPNASFAILDDERSTVQFIRVEYDIVESQMAIHRAGLPRILADRLEVGT